MSAYASYDGIPAIANRHLLTDILRTEWGYKYWVTSDAGARDRICTAFKMCQSNPLDKEAITLFVSLNVPASLNLQTYLSGPSGRKRRREEMGNRNYN